MTTDDYELRARIEAVSNAAGDEDDLLTVAIPPETPVGAVLERVEEDRAEAEYIDADESSEARRATLERAQRVLHDYGETPGNGLVLYVGVPEDETDPVEYVFDDLPDPVEEEVYEWSNEFDVGPLEAVTGATATYGLLVVERGGAALGRLDGDRVETVETIESDVPGKTKAGGQSADRFERERERRTEEFFEAVAAEAERAFLRDERGAGIGGGEGGGDSDGSGERDGGRIGTGDEGGTPGESENGDEAVAVDGLLVGGTTVTVDRFVDGEYLDDRLQDRILGGSFSVEYASEQGLRQLAEKGREAVADDERESVRAALERFREGLRDGDEEVAYGEDAVDRALEFGAVETALVSGGLPVEEVREYEERTAEEGGEAVVVPPDTEDGARFAETFGVAAVLRFPID